MKGVITVKYFSTVLSEQKKFDYMTDVSGKNKTTHAPSPYSYITSHPYPHLNPTQISTNRFPSNHHYPDNNPTPSHSPSNEQLKFILNAKLNNTCSHHLVSTNSMGILIGRVLPHSPYQLERVSGIFHSNPISFATSSLMTGSIMEETSFSNIDFISQVKSIFRSIDNALSLLNTTKVGIISLSLFVVNLEKHASMLSRELSYYLHPINVDVSIVGVCCLIPPNILIQAKRKILTRNALLSNFIIERY